MAEADEKGQMIKAYGFNPVAAQQGLWSTDPVWQAETLGGSLTDPKARYDWLHTDHLGTPILATTKEGQTSWKAIAESFGSTQIIGQDIEVSLRFPGQYFDAETGTYYNFHRDYRPNAGRYLQSDPIGLEGGLNLFGYVDANPIFHTDSTGEYWQAPVLFCLRFPRICQSILKCFKNPVSCRRRFCLAGNRLYHPICDFPRCVAEESCPTTYMKLVLAEGCYMNRLAVQWFCGKKTDPEHENEKAIAWKKGQECLALVAANCKSADNFIMMTANIRALIKSSDWDALSDLLAKNPEIACCVDEFGQSFLMYLAGKGGSADLIRKSIALGANPNYSAPCGSNAISEAISHGNRFGLDTIEELRALIEMGADPNLVADAGFPALHWAVVMNQIGHLKVLIELGADMKGKTSDSPPETLMQVAERMMSSEIIELLKSYGVRH